VGVNALNDSVYDVAQRAFKFLINKYPDSTNYLFQLALVYKTTMQIDSAILTLNKIIEKAQIENIPQEVIEKLYNIIHEICVDAQSID